MVCLKCGLKSFGWIYLIGKNNPFAVIRYTYSSLTWFNLNRRRYPETDNDTEKAETLKRAKTTRFI